MSWGLAWGPFLYYTIHMKKICSICKVEKDLSEFWKDKSKVLGVEGHCIECKRIRKRRYRVSHTEKLVKYNKAWDKKHPARAIHTNLLRRAHKKNFEICTQQEFIVWYSQQLHVCHYCNCTEQEQRQDRASRLEIDRKNNDIGYTIENMVFACSRCNIAKFNFWDYDTFKTHIAPGIRAARQSII